MKTMRIKTLVVLMTLAAFTMSAQDSGFSMFWVHEDPVHPSKVSTYEEAAKELVENMKKYNVQGTSWISVNLSDFRYLYVTPIENMAALDSNGMAPLFEGMGQEAASAMFAKMNGCYDRHSDYILYLVNGLSYQPSGIDQTPEGQNYRKFFYLYTSVVNIF